MIYEYLWICIFLYTPNWVLTTDPSHDACKSAYLYAAYSYQVPGQRVLQTTDKNILEFGAKTTRG